VKDEPAGETLPLWRPPEERRNYWLLPVLAAGALTALLCCAGTLVLIIPD
jgi:hypothetical protein